MNRLNCVQAAACMAALAIVVAHPLNAQTINPHTGTGPTSGMGTIKAPEKSGNAIVKPGSLVAINKAADKCFNKKPDGTKVEVKCPDVIVALPDSSSSPQHTTEMVAKKANAKQFVPRSQINKLHTSVSLEGGTYNCYNENPPNSGHFDRIQCPDIIVLEPGT